MLLSLGIGMIYEGIDENDRMIVDELFSAGAIQILICTYKMSWDLN